MAKKQSQLKVPRPVSERQTAKMLLDYHVKILSEQARHPTSILPQNMRTDKVMAMLMSFQRAYDEKHKDRNVYGDFINEIINGIQGAANYELVERWVRYSMVLAARYLEIVGLWEIEKYPGLEEIYSVEFCFGKTHLNREAIENFMGSEGDKHLQDAAPGGYHLIREMLTGEDSPNVQWISP
jgi:hypothetical protein